MQSTDAHSEPTTLTPETESAFSNRLSTVGWSGLRVSALLLWVGIGSYAWFRTLQPPTYAVSVIGAVLGLPLAASLFGHTTHGCQHTPVSRVSPNTRLLLGGCLVGVVAGSLTVVRSVDQIGASQPTLSTLTVVGAGLLCGALLVVAGRQSIALAGFAGVAVAVSWASAPDVAVVETVVFGSQGLYGPLTVAAVTWIAPGCLLVGCWRAAGTDRRLVTLWRATVDDWGLTTHTGRLGRLTATGGCVLLLAGWQTGSLESLAVVGLGVPAGLLGVASLWAATQGALPTAADTQTSDWASPAVMVGGPLGVMGLVGVGYRLPVGTVLVVGCLCCLGLCVIRPFVSPTDRQSTVSEQGVGTVLNGSVLGAQLLARVVIPLAVAGGSLSLLSAAGVSTWLVATVVWLSGGHPVGVALVVGGCCVALGRVLGVLGGYVVGVILGVPLLLLFSSMPETTAHVLVSSAVLVGGLLVDEPRPPAL